MSSASAPDPAAGFPAAEPQPATLYAPRSFPAATSGGGPRLLLFAAVLAVAVGGGGRLPEDGRRAPQGPSGATTITLRTAPVLFGDLQRTVRISGVVQAEKFAAIMAPQLHGSHSDRGRGGDDGERLHVGHHATARAAWAVRAFRAHRAAARRLPPPPPPVYRQFLGQRRQSRAAPADSASSEAAGASAVSPPAAPRVPLRRGSSGGGSSRQLLGGRQRRPGFHLRQHARQRRRR